MEILIFVLLIVNTALVIAALIVITNQKPTAERNGEEQDGTMYRKTVSQYLHSNLDRVSCETCRYRGIGEDCEKCRQALENVNWKISEEQSYLLAGEITAKK